MKSTINNLFPLVSRIDRQHIQLIILIISLSLLVLGAGAPACGGSGLAGGGG
ncbi:hypothetical protein ACFLZW_03765 [Chloroflexota bacterium]